MHRTLWPPLLVYHQYRRHRTTPLPVAGPPLAGVRSSSPWFSTGFLELSAARRFKPQLAFLTTDRRVRNWKGRAASAYKHSVGTAPREHATKGAGQLRSLPKQAPAFTRG